MQKERLSLRVPEVSLQHCRHSMSRHKLQAHIPRKTWRLWQHRFPLIRSRWTVRQPSWKHPETDRSSKSELESVKQVRADLPSDAKEAAT